MMSRHRFKEMIAHAGLAIVAEARYGAEELLLAVLPSYIYRDGSMLDEYLGGILFWFSRRFDDPTGCGKPGA